MSLSGYTLRVPTVHRLDDYLGLWLYEPSRFLAQWQRRSADDLFAHVAAAPSPRPTSTLEMVPIKGDKSIAVVSAVGTLMKQASSFGGTSTVQLRRDIRAAANDPNIASILMRVDSPGGTVAGTADLAADVRAARKRKPVWSHIEDLGASAAYWYASQADAVYANTGTALIGSIGTFNVIYDVSQAAEKEGVRTLVFRTGPMKGVGVPGAPVTDDQAAEMQRVVNELQTHFDAAVRTGRGMSASQLTAVRSGGVWPASEAVDLKLIDGIRSLDSTLAALAVAK